MKMISISNKLFNTAFTVNNFVMLFFLHAGLMMKEQSSFECGACLLGFSFYTKDFPSEWILVLQMVGHCQVQED